jgi:peptidoglycan/xylan/chitin deacetylase (PgdA/CDA1 family)
VIAVWVFVVVVVGAGLWLAPMGVRWLQQRRLARICAERRALVLTYDDGPGTAVTPRLLDLLRLHRANASFFAIGRSATAAPEMLDRAVREGHEVGSHSWEHVHAWKSLPWTAARDVRRGLRTVRKWAGRRALFRPPYGKVTPFTWIAAAASRSRFAWWTLDSGDTWERLPPAEQVVTGVRKRGGGVVLMHDNDRDPERAMYVLDLTERLLWVARDEGLSVVTLGDLLADSHAAR